MKTYKMICQMAVCTGMIFILSLPIIGAPLVGDFSEEAMRMMNKGDADEAYSLLKENYHLNEASEQELFLLGLSARESGRFNEAVTYFHQFLKINPGVPRVLLELARTYYLKGDYSQAEIYFKRVKALDPPRLVAENIDRYLNSIKGDHMRKMAYQVEVGYLYDDNVNAGPSTDTILINGNPFALSDDGKDTADHGKLYSFSANHNYPLSVDHAWQSQFLFRLVDYNDENAFDSKSLSLSSGPIWRRGQSLLSIPYTTNVTKFGGQYNFDKFFTYSYGITPRVRHRFNDKIYLNMGVAYEHKYYQDDQPKTYDSVALNLGLNYYWTPKTMLWIEGRTEGVYAVSPAFSYKSGDLTLGVECKVLKNWTLTASLSHKNTSYQEKESIFTDRRFNETVTLYLGTSYEIKPWDATIRFSLVQTNSNSTLGIYEYDRKYYSMVYAKSF